MKIRILGTAAGEGWPALFCDCAVCRKARKLGGRNIRTRSSLQIDGDLKIDLPPDTLSHVHKYGLELHKLRYLLITHSHSDHLHAADLECIREPFAVPPVFDSLKVLANRRSIDMIRNAIDDPCSGQPGLLKELSAFNSYSLPPYKITTLKARHKPDEEALNFIIEKEGKKVFYTCDTGFYPQENWDFLRGQKVDMVICECTEGPRRADYGHHMGLPDVFDFKQKAEETGLTGPETPWILTHFSHGGGLLHEELESLTGPHGFQVAWDGMEIDLS